MKNFLLFFLLSFFFEGVFGESVTVSDGDSVTFHTGLTEIQKDDVLQWRFGTGRDRIARVTEGSDPTVYNDVLGGRFKDRLKLDNQTGDLTITNIKTEHDGLYEISINAIALMTFSVIVVSGVDEVKSVSVIEGDSVTLNTGTIKQRDDVIEWRFGDLNSLIAENNRKTGNFSTSDTDRLQLDYWTGSLTIRNIGTNHSGLYEAGIRKSSSRHTIHKSYSVTASGDREMTSALSVMKGDSITLQTDLTEMQTDDVMQWMFGDTVIAEISKAHERFSTSDGPDGRFGDRLKLDHQTRSLTITDTIFTDSGLYKLKISSSRFTINQRIIVTVTGEMTSALSVKKGDSVTLHTDLTEIQTDDVMQWMFGDTLLAEINKAGDRFSTSDGPDGRFGDRLKLDNQTRSLTITDTRYTDSGLYELKIISSRFIINKRITVTVTGLSSGEIAGIVVGLLAFAVSVAAVWFYQRHKISKLKAWIYNRTMLSVMEGENITLKPDEVHKDDKLLWMFRGSCIAERESAAHSFTLHDDLPDGRFEGRLEPDPQTGSLTIMNTRTTDTGGYELLTTRPGKTSMKRFNVSVFADRGTGEIKNMSVNEGGSVTLKTDVTDMKEVEQIQWKFGLNIRLAEITRGTQIFSPIASKILNVDLKLDHQTGSLTINKIRPTDAGIYMLRKMKGGNIETILFKVKVSDSTDNRNNSEEVRLTTVYG